MFTQELPNTSTPRPSRLNSAGWCMYCVERHCDSARCIRLHANSVWEVCGSCDGSEYVDYATLERCTTCYNGLIEAAANTVAEVVDLHSYVVTYPPQSADRPRNDASDLVPRVDAGPGWDYHADAQRCAREAEQRNPEAVAYAKANRNDPAAGWAAYGVSY
ncbi:hypothetical protein ACWDYH_39700 [Nocardia goodfellowii]